MWEVILDYAINSGAGLFTLLFIGLLVWVLRTNDKREQRYISITEKLANSLSCVETIKNDVDDIKSLIITGKVVRKYE
jgi:hypothetical protein